MRVLFLGLLFCLTRVTAEGQESRMDTIAAAMQRIVGASGDSLKLEYSDELAGRLAGLGRGEYDAAKGVKYLGYRACLNAPAELFSWSVPLSCGTAFYNYFRFEDERRNVLLKYLPGDTGTPPYLFYDFWAFESAGKEYFILLGWGETSKTNRKAIMVADFTSAGKADFSRRLLKRGNSRSSAMTFEYGRGIGMTLKQEKNGKRIVFDNLSSGEEKYEGAWMFYGPDGTQNSFELRKGIWEWKENAKREVK